MRTAVFWPLWVTGFHLISVCTHVATIALPQLRPITYFALQSFWSLPGLLFMVAGIMLDRRAGIPKSARPVVVGDPAHGVGPGPAR